MSLLTEGGDGPKHDTQSRHQKSIHHGNDMSFSTQSVCYRNSGYALEVTFVNSTVCDADYGPCRIDVVEHGKERNHAVRST